MTEPNENTTLLSRARSPSTSHSRRLFIGVTLTLLALSLLLYRRDAPTVVSRQHLTSPIVLLAVGDWGRYGSPAQIRVARAMAQDAFKHNALAIVSTGDNFYEEGVKSVHDPQLNESYDSVYNVHVALSQRPFWPVLGNHDHLGDVDAQVAYSSRSQTWDFPAPYYVRHLTKHLTLLLLDTTPFGTDEYAIRARHRAPRSRPNSQVKWLSRQLKIAARGGRAVLVVGHHNPYSGSTCGHCGATKLREQIGPLLHAHQHRVIAYLSGHEHALMHLVIHGIDHLVSGAGSELDPVCRPNGQHSHKWREHHGVLAGKHAPFVSSTNGFFRLEFNAHHKTFVVSAVDSYNRVVYKFGKRVRF